LRGFTNNLTNGSFGIGAAIGACGSIVHPSFIDPGLGWRLAFLIGVIIGLIILVMRLWIPESPRWLITRDFVAEADAVRGIEAHFPGGPHGAAAVEAGWGLAAGREPLEAVSRPLSFVD
jgi:MFS family permease